MTLECSGPAGQTGSTDWAAYATAYDLLALHNPEYKALMSGFETFLSSVEVPRVIYDVGGGTGNYTAIAANAFPDSAIRFIEPDPGMMGLAKRKLAGQKNIEFQNVSLEKLSVVDKADLIVCVHALYAMPNPAQRLKDLHDLLRPGGVLYLVDLGRYMAVSDWRRYLFLSILKAQGPIGALKIFWRGREIAKQNAAIYESQKKGEYWTHTEEEFAVAVKKAGFEILKQQPVYRGYSDLVVCRPKP